MKTLQRLTIVLLFFFSFTAWSQNPGSLDPTFDTDGIVTFSGTQNNWKYSTIVQPDGKIIAVGRIQFDIFMVRYNSDGTLDNSFNLDGSAVHGVSSNTNGTKQYSLALQSDGKILMAAGSANTGQPYGTFIYRLNTDGSLDNSFNNDGQLICDFGYQSSLAPIAVQSDDKIVVAGREFGGINEKLIVSRYNSDGSQDSLFGTGGMLEVNSARYAEAILIQEDGKILLAGETNGIPQALVLRLNPDGTFDNSFDSDGRVIIDNGTEIFRGKSLAVQSDGKIVVAAEVGPALNSFLLIRLNTDGTLDNSFNTDAIATYQLGTGANGVNSVTLQPDGKIVAVGFATNGSNDDFAIIRLNQDGSIDNSFNSTGFVLTDIDSSSADGGTSVAMQPDGKIVVAGYSGDNLAIARYLSGLNVGIIEAGNNGAIVSYVYPNPVGEQVSFEYELQQQSEVTLQLADISGKVIRTFFTVSRTQGKQKEILSISNLDAGSYLLLLKAGDSLTSVKIVKN